MDAIRDVCLHSASLAIIRFSDRYERSLLSLLKRKELAGEVICRFEPLAVMSERHPLAGTSVLTADMLEQSVEVLCEDTSLADYLNEPAEPEHFPSVIRLHEGSGLPGLLSHLTSAFAFAPPLPESVLKDYHLVQKKCQATRSGLNSHGGQNAHGGTNTHGAACLPGKMTDLLIYPEDARLTRAENAFLEAVRQAAPAMQGDRNSRSGD